MYKSIIKHNIPITAMAFVSNYQLDYFNSLPPFGTGSTVTITFAENNEHTSKITGNSWKVVATFTGTYTRNRKIYFHEPPASHYYRKNPYVDVPWYVLENNATSLPKYTVVINDPVFCMYTADIKLSE